MVVSGTALRFPRYGGVCGSAGQRVALRFGDRCAGQALAVASGGGLRPAAGGDDAERERGKSAASEDGPGGVTCVDEAGAGAGHDRAGDGDADGTAELAGAGSERAGDTDLVGRQSETAVLMIGGLTRPAPRPKMA